MFPKDLKILVADDEEGIRDLVSLSVEDLGMEVRVASNGHQAVELAKKNFIALALLDFQMPKLNGIEAAQKIFQISPWTDLYLITAYATPEEIRAAYASGIRRVFYKPFRPEQIEALVRKAFHYKLKELRKKMGFLLKKLSFHIKTSQDKKIHALLQWLHDKSFRYALIDELATDFKLQRSLAKKDFHEIFKDKRFLLLVLKKARL